MAIDLPFHELLPFVQSFSGVFLAISELKLLASFYSKSYSLSLTSVMADLVFHEL